VTVAGVAAVLPAPAPAGAEAPAGYGPWKAILQLRNNSPLQLRLVDKTKTEMTNWEVTPREDVTAGSEVVSVIDSAQPSFGHGLVQLTTWAAYYPDRQGHDVYAGMLVVANGVECSPLGPPVCLDYHGFQAAWSSPPTPGLFQRGEGPTITWVHSGGPPDGFVTLMEVRIGRTPSTGAMKGSDLPAGMDGPVVVGPGPIGMWGWTQQIQNRTPYTLTRAWNWNSQGTNYLGNLPAGIAAGGGSQYLFGNSVTLHGPQSFVVYNATNPQKNNEYVGSVVFESQTDCEFGVKVPDIPTTCTVWKVASNSFGASTVQTGDVVLGAHSDTTGLQPFDLFAQSTVLLDHVRPPAPPARWSARSVDDQKMYGTSIFDVRR